MISGITARSANYAKLKLAKKGLLCLFILFACACKKGAITTKSSDTTTTTQQRVVFPRPTYDPSHLDTTKAFNAQPIVNTLARQDYLEISGVAASRINAGVLYIHNDSGNPNQIYLTNVAGTDIGTMNLPVANRDWEDIAVGPGPIAGKSYVYVGDIGDNHSVHPSTHVYRFQEPDLKGLTSPVMLNITNVDDIELKYPDGARDAETLMVDPATKDIYIASKQSNLAQVYVARYPQSTTSATTMEPVVALLFNKATSGDISSDGTEILIRSNELIWYWKLAPGTGISAGLMTQPEVASYAHNEPQGEGIGFAADGSGYYTATEIKDYPGSTSTISFYKRK